MHVLYRLILGVVHTSFVQYHIFRICSDHWFRIFVNAHDPFQVNFNLVFHTPKTRFRKLPSRLDPPRDNMIVKCARARWRLWFLVWIIRPTNYTYGRHFLFKIACSWLWSSYYILHGIAYHLKYTHVM